MKRASLAIAAWFVITGTVSAQDLNYWSYGKLHQKADAVLIVHAESKKPFGSSDAFVAEPLSEANSKTVCIESKLRVMAVLKGDEKRKSVTLIHYVPKEGSEAPEARWVKLQYGDQTLTVNDFDGTTKTFSQPVCQYLMFLKRRASGDYELLTWGERSQTSVIELPPRYVPPQRSTGDDPNAPAFSTGQAPIDPLFATTPNTPLSDYSR